MSKKDPNPIDKHVGSRIRMRRMMLGMSQDKLSHGLNLTFQQVQKYENGSNRVSASRLQQIAGLLQVPVSWFFEGAQTQGDLIAGNPVDDPLVKLGATKDGLALARAFNGVADPRLRAVIVSLAEASAAVTCPAVHRDAA